jgi:hypothetical protein
VKALLQLFFLSFVILITVEIAILMFILTVCKTNVTFSKIFNFQEDTIIDVASSDEGSGPESDVVSYDSDEDVYFSAKDVSSTETLEVTQPDDDLVATTSTAQNPITGKIVSF